MPNIAGPIAWTPQDEERLRALTERKAEFHRRCREPLVLFVEGDCGPPVERFDSARFVNWLIKNADDIRDLLQPFDSGVRVAPPKSEG